MNPAQTAQKSKPVPAAVPLTEQAFQAAFRRGRTLVWMVAAVSAAVCLQDALRHVWMDPSWNEKISRVLGFALAGYICWRVSQGGSASTGLLTFFYGAMSLAFCILLVMLCVGAVILAGFVIVAVVSRYLHPMTLPVGPSHSPGLSGRAEWNNLVNLGKGAWSVFSLWVLAFSKDARLYRHIRQSGLPEQEALEHEWRQLQHRPAPDPP